LPTPHLFSPEGQARLAALLRRRPLLAFDFDGTLAPIVPRPHDARLSSAVSTRLRRLSLQLPVAIVTGRTVADVRTRLDFEPAYIVGNHGAEEDTPRDVGTGPPAAPALDGLRAVLHHHSAELAALGVMVEDKRLSLALHYRLSAQREQAREFIAELLGPLSTSLHVFAGKMVVNVTPPHAPDKALAMHSLLARCGASCAFFAGDDVNDEPVFASAPADWLTVRVGRDEAASRAHFCLAGPHEMALLLERMCGLLGSNLGS
jgi:trehalose 6-phosphate phosphatase